MRVNAPLFPRFTPVAPSIRPARIVPLAATALLALPILLLALSSAGRAADSADRDIERLKQAPEDQGWASFPGLAASLGSGRRVVGRVTFSREKASAGGWIYAAARTSTKDAAALRLSEAVLTSGGLVSHAALEARRHGVAALILEKARWGSPEDPFLRLERTVFGEPSELKGFEVRLARKSVPHVVQEGDVVAVDPAAGRLLVPPAGLSQVYLEAAAALRAYDGLRDGRALSHWAEGKSHELADSQRLDLALYLVEELAGRVGGAAGMKDLALICKTLRKNLGPHEKKLLEEHEARVLGLQVRRVLLHFDEAEEDLSGAAPGPASRICRRVAAGWERVALLARTFKAPGLRNARRRYKALSMLCEDKTAAGEGDGPEGPGKALRKAGATLPLTARIPARLYRGLVESDGLSQRIDSVLENPSLFGRRKSERIRELIRGAELPRDLLREVAGDLPTGGSWAFLVPGVGPRVLEGRDLSPLKEYWAALWTPARMAARAREGRGVSDEEAGVPLIRLDSCRVSAMVLSRDPASGKARLTVNAGYGEIEGVLSGRSAPDQYVLARNGREVLPAILGDKRVRLERSPEGRLVEREVPASQASRRALDPEQLEKLASAARVLESHYGHGLEIVACFSDGRLVILGAAPL